MDKAFLSRFIRGVVSSGVGTFSQSILGFVSLMIAVRYVSKEAFGVFVLIQVIASFFSALSSLALENIAVTKFIASVEEERKAQIANTAFGYKLLLGLILGIIILPCRPLVALVFKSEDLTRLLIFVPLTFILTSFNDFLLKVMQGFHQYKKMAISQLIQGAVKCGLTVLLLVYFKAGILGIIYAFLIGSAASIVYQYWVVPIRKRLNFDRRLFVEMFRFGFPLGLNSLLTFGFMRIGRLMIGALINPVGVANYEVGSRLPENSGQMFQSFWSVFFPNMSELCAKKRYAEAEKVLNNSLRLVTFITLFGALVALLFQKQIVRILFSAKYLESAPVLSILMISLSIGLVGNILGSTLVSMGQSDKPVKINIVDFVVSITGNLVLIPIFGFMGAAYAALLSRCATNPLNAWFVKKSHLRLEISQYLKPLATFGVVGLIVVLAKPDSFWMKAALMGLFLIGSALLSIIKKKDFFAIFESLKHSPNAVEQGESRLV